MNFLSAYQLQTALTASALASKKLEDEVQYFPRARYTLPRYQVSNPYGVTKEGVSELLDSVPDYDEFIVVVTGVYSLLYPGKEENYITLTYKVTTDSLIDLLDDEDVEDGTDFANSLFPSDLPDVGRWEVVESIGLIDRP